MKKGQASILVITILVFVGLFLGFLLKPFTIVGAGQRGVVMHFGQVQDQILGEGLHFYVPISTSVKKIDVRVQKDDVKAEAGSKDLQTVNTDIVINWHVDADNVNKIYQSVGDVKDVSEKILTPAVNEVVKAAAAQKTAEEILQKRPELKADIDLALEERLRSYNIILDDVSITNVDFTDEFNAAIEAKQVAQQQAQQAVFLKQKAQAEADAAIEQARGQSESQKLLQQTLTPSVLQQQWIQRWNGQLPQYVSGADANLFLNLPR